VNPIFLASIWGGTFADLLIFSRAMESAGFGYSSAVCGLSYDRSLGADFDQIVDFDYFGYGNFVMRFDFEYRDLSTLEDSSGLSSIVNRQTDKKSTIPLSVTSLSCSTTSKCSASQSCRVVSRKPKKIVNAAYLQKSKSSDAPTTPTRWVCIGADTAFHLPFPVRHRRWCAGAANVTLGSDAARDGEAMRMFTVEQLARGDSQKAKALWHASHILLIVGLPSTITRKLESVRLFMQRGGSNRCLAATEVVKVYDRRALAIFCDRSEDAWFWQKAVTDFQSEIDPTRSAAETQKPYTIPMLCLGTSVKPRWYRILSKHVVD